MPSSSTQLRVDEVDVFVHGQGPETVVMIHGWPDTHHLWDAQVEAFQAYYRCVRFTLPGFDLQHPRRAWSLAELIDLFKKIVEAVSPDKPVTLLLHDWGAMFGYQFALAHPALVRRIVGVDVGNVNDPSFAASLSAAAKAMVASYQLSLVTAWAVGGFVGDMLTRSVARALGSPAESSRIGSQMNYPYLIQWTGRYGSYRETKAVEPACPMLYVYGADKPFQFHTPEWLAALAARPDCTVQGLPARHWVMRDVPEQFNALVLGWLRAGDAPADAPKKPRA